MAHIFGRASLRFEIHSPRLKHLDVEFRIQINDVFIFELLSSPPFHGFLVKIPTALMSKWQVVRPPSLPCDGKTDGSIFIPPP